MTQYPIDFLKRDDKQRFFPVTHPSAIYDGDKNLYIILDERFAMKADKTIRMNGSVICNNVFSSGQIAGGGHYDLARLTKECKVVCGGGFHYASI